MHSREAIRSGVCAGGGIDFRANEVVSGFRQSPLLPGRDPIPGTDCIVPCKAFDNRTRMADTLSPKERSRLMARIRSRDTKPEMYVRKAVWRAGFRYRLHSRTLPGKPDLALTQYKVAVFVHGCFWHQHGCAKTSRPSSNREFWDRKLDGNVARDARNRAALQALGWTVLTVWECGLEEGTADVLGVLKQLRAMRANPNGRFDGRQSTITTMPCATPTHAHSGSVAGPRPDLPARFDCAKPMP